MWKSDAQRRWGNSPAGVAAMGQAKVNEFNDASKDKQVPERIKPPSMKAGTGPLTLKQAMAMRRRMKVK